MEQKILVYYRNAYAHYRVFEESEGIYTAELISYEGDPKNTPCESVTVVRGVKRWWGCKDLELLSQLGEGILRAIDGYIIDSEELQLVEKKNPAKKSRVS